MESAIEIQGLTKRFGDVRAVEDLRLDIHSGEMFALVGPDGAGKTTTMRMLTGVTRPSSGTARILGYDLTKEAEAVKRRIGYLSQRFSLYTDLTVDENIEFFAGIHGVEDFRSRREELLEFTRLAPFRTRMAEKLSGGMKQKLALACTLVHTPDLIFLDEPTTGVDPVSRRDFWKILSNLLKTGMTIILTTPYMDEAERCHRVGLMDKGRLMMADTPRVLKALMPGIVLEVVCDLNRRAQDVLKGAPGVREVQAFGDRLNVAVDEESTGLHAIRSALEGRGIRISLVRRIPPSLENVFISMVKNSGGAP